MKYMIRASCDVLLNSLSLSLSFCMLPGSEQNNRSLSSFPRSTSAALAFLLFFLSLNNCCLSPSPLVIPFSCLPTSSLPHSSLTVLFLAYSLSIPVLSSFIFIIIQWMWLLGTNGSSCSSSSSAQLVITATTTRACSWLRHR